MLNSICISPLPTHVYFLIVLINVLCRQIHMPFKGILDDCENFKYERKNKQINLRLCVRRHDYYPFHCSGHHMTYHMILYWLLPSFTVFIKQCSENRTCFTFVMTVSYAKGIQQDFCDCNIYST